MLWITFILALVSVNSHYIFVNDFDDDLEAITEYGYDNIDF